MLVSLVRVMQRLGGVLLGGGVIAALVVPRGMVMMLRRLGMMICGTYMMIRCAVLVGHTPLL
jgi:hypothetical protein